jgi:hypothetical protein
MIFAEHVLHERPLNVLIKEIFAIIDAMPMRQQEIKKKPK